MNMDIKKYFDDLEMQVADQTLVAPHLFTTIRASLQPEIESLRAQVAELEKDAERYRHIKSTGKFGFDSGGVFMPNAVWKKEKLSDMSKETDEAIDQAIANEKGE